MLRRVVTAAIATWLVGGCARFGFELTSAIEQSPEPTGGSGASPEPPASALPTPQGGNAGQCTGPCSILTDAAVPLEVPTRSVGPPPTQEVAGGGSGGASPLGPFSGGGTVGDGGSSASGGGPTATCDDGVQNQDESGIDCGGSLCGPCGTLCFDELQDQDETGTDCGGSCPLCSPGTAPCVAMSFSGHAYEFCQVRSAWNDGRIDCLSKGLRLARVDDASENDWIKATAAAVLPDVLSNLWVAGTDLVTEGEWVWHPDTLYWSGGLSGSAVGAAFEDWASNEPNDNGNEDCLAVVLRVSDPPGWNDSSCDELLWYLCEAY